MSGIRTTTRLEELERLRTRTQHEISWAAAKGEPADRLRQLLVRVDEALVPERAAAELARKHLAAMTAGDKVTTRLIELGVTSHDVKVWAVGQGLLPAVLRGRIRGELVEAYAQSHEQHITTPTTEGAA